MVVECLLSRKEARSLRAAEPTGARRAWAQRDATDADWVFNHPLPQCRQRPIAAHDHPSCHPITALSPSHCHPGPLSGHDQQHPGLPTPLGDGDVRPLAGLHHPRPQ